MHLHDLEEDTLRVLVCVDLGELGMCDLILADLLEHAGCNKHPSETG